MSKEYTNYLFNPLVLSIASILIYFIPEFAIIEKWIIALLYIFFVWIGSLYRYVIIKNIIHSRHPGSVNKDINELELIRNDINRRDVILEVNFNITTKAGKFFFDKLIRKSQILITFDKDFLDITSNEQYKYVLDKKFGFEVYLFRERTEEYRYLFILMPGKDMGKVSGYINFYIKSASKWKIVNYINNYIVFRKTKRLLRPIKISIR